VIASRPLRRVSLLVMGFVVFIAARGISSGVTSGGGLLDGGGQRSGRTETSSTATGRTTLARVAYVVDGDTVEVTTRSGRDVSVRIIGISAPEIPHPGKAGECYGRRSTRHLEQLLPAGTSVVLVADPGQDEVDVYGRWLRYIERGGRDLGRSQIVVGAAVARQSSTPVTRHDDYVDAERQARAQRTGMWTTCR